MTRHHIAGAAFGIFAALLVGLMSHNITAGFAAVGTGEIEMGETK